MKNQHDLDQLQRHANKKGAWQAKLAYAMYLLKYKDNKTEAKVYLDELDQEKVPLQYTIRARKLKLQYKIAEIQDGVAYSELMDQISNYIEPDYSYTRKIKASPDFLYKKIRYHYEEFIEKKPLNLEQKKAGMNKVIDDLKSLLLKKNEMPDFLRAKIYFQLIHMHVKLASLQGRRDDLEKAKQYCELLTGDEALKQMVKAKKAKLVKKQIASVTDQPLLDFKTDIKNSFKAGRKGNKVLFKFVGLIIGNVIDLCFFCMFKLFHKYNVVETRKKKQDKHWAKNFFQLRGFAATFKYFGKRFGKHIVGNTLGGPAAALLGVLTYPFYYLYHRYGLKMEAVANTANNTIKFQTPLSENAESEKAKNDQTHKRESTHQSLRSIFARKENGQDQNQKKIIPVSLLDQIVRVEHVTIDHHPSYFAYGAVFANAREAVSSSKELSPIYTSSNNNRAVQ